jgi:hypothetical protein
MCNNMLLVYGNLYIYIYIYIYYDVFLCFLYFPCSLLFVCMFITVLCRSLSTLRLTVSQYDLGIEHPCETSDQILLPVGMLLSEICGLVSGGRPL